MKILLSGSSGFIGSALHTFLQQEGHQVIRLLRNHSNYGTDAISWDPSEGKLKPHDFEGFDAVIHLAGAGIGDHRWSKEYKKQLFLSRCRDTWLLSQVLCRLYQPPKVMISASAIGYYGDRNAEELTEESKPGTGFLADLCVHWEKATDAIENRGTRVVHPRFGAVLGNNGGMLSKMLPLFRWGLGGKMGSGKQVISWIALEDLIGGIYHCLMTESLSGAVNLVSPNPVTQAEFAALLAKKLHRPAFCHLPAWIIKLLLGEMGKELLLFSQKVKPVKLLETGYHFRYPTLEETFFKQR